jgi:hypothetical protein
MTTTDTVVLLVLFTLSFAVGVGFCHLMHL